MLYDLTVSIKWKTLPALAVIWGGTPALGYRITFTRAFFFVCFFLEIENFFGLFLFELGHLAG